MRWSRNATLWIAALVLLVATLGVGSYLKQTGEDWSATHQAACIRTALTISGGNACEELARATLSETEPSRVQPWFHADSILFVPLYLTTFVLFALASGTFLFAAGTRGRVVALAVLVGIALGAAIADWRENAYALSMLRDVASDPPSPVDVQQLGAATLLKWRMIGLALKLILLSVFAAAFMRFTSIGFRARLMQKVPGWKSLRVYASNPVFKYSPYIIAAVPAAARFLERLRAERQDDAGIVDLVLALPDALPTTWKLLYLSAILWFFGFLCFTIRAMNPVKDYKDWRDFKDRNKGNPQLLQYLQEIANTESVPARDLMLTLDDMKLKGWINVPEGKSSLTLTSDYASIKSWLSAAKIPVTHVGDAYVKVEALASDCRFGSRLLDAAMYYTAFAIYFYFFVRNVVFVFTH